MNNVYYYNNNSSLYYIDIGYTKLRIEIHFYF